MSIISLKWSYFCWYVNFVHHLRTIENNFISQFRCNLFLSKFSLDFSCQPWGNELQKELFSVFFLNSSNTKICSQLRAVVWYDSFQSSESESRIQIKLAWLKTSLRSSEDDSQNLTDALAHPAQSYLRAGDDNDYDINIGAPRTALLTRILQWISTESVISLAGDWTNRWRGTYTLFICSQHSENCCSRQNCSLATSSFERHKFSISFQISPSFFSPHAHMLRPQFLN